MGSNPLERTSKLNSRLNSRDFLLFYFLRSITIYLKMIKKEKFPILEFDSHRKARINPSDITSSASLKSPYLVITFFYEVIKRLLKEKIIKKYLKIKGENDLILYKFTDSDVYLMPGIIGGPATGGYLDELSGYGIKKVIFCGGGGVLSKEIETGKLLLVTGAIRDEGFSYHYLKPSRIVYSSKPILKTMENYLDEKGISYLKGLV